MSSASSQRSSAAKGNLIYQNNSASQGAALSGESSSITMKVRKNNSNRKPAKKFKFDESDVHELKSDVRQRDGD